MTIALGCAPHTDFHIPSAMTVVNTNWSPVTTFLDSAIAAGAAPGAVLGVSVAEQRYLYATGRLTRDEPSPAEPTTIYDLASLTKVVGLTSAVMLAVDDGKLELDAPVQRYVPAFQGEGKERVTIRLLLAHGSGLPAWRPLFRETETREQAFALADTTPLRSTPGTADVYSDLGMIVLAQAVETVYHERLDSLLARRLFQPLGMTSVGFLPAEDRARIAPTELDQWRGRVLRGEVHDENAARLDGVSGHAGLFGSAPDLLTFAEWMMTGGQADRWRGGPVDQSDRPTVSPSARREFTRRQNIIPGSHRALGWDTPSPGSSAGDLLSPESIGHTGLTGTSLWIDPVHHLAIVLLSNRVNPTRDNSAWAPVRARIADLVMTTLFEDAR
ncbi:MAG: serine hydrolase domain-containing protein [Gemmatimonadales bacterium]